MAWFNNSEIVKIRRLTLDLDQELEVVYKPYLIEYVDERLSHYFTSDEVTALINATIAPDGGGPGSRSFFQLGGGFPDENFGGNENIDLEGVS
jgi:hypothetical protein